MVKPTQVELPAIHVTAQAPTNNFSVSARPPPVNEAIRFGSYIWTEIIQWNKEFEMSLALVISAVETEVAEVRGGPSLDDETEVGLVQELTFLDQVIARKTADIEALSPVADRFYGVDPLALTTDQQVSKIAVQLRGGADLGYLRTQITATHEAAYKRKFAAEGLVALNGRATQLRAKLVEVQARDAAHRAELEAQRLKDEAHRLKLIAANTFHISTGALSQAQIVIAGSRAALADGVGVALQTAIRSAVAALAGTVSGFFIGIGTLLYAPKLGNGELPERFAVTLPLSDLGPAPSNDLHAIAAAGGTVDMPIRLGTKTVDDDRSEIIVIQADGMIVPNKVRVVAATFNADQNLYTVTTADTPSRTLTWTPVVAPTDASTTLPVEAPPVPVYEGAAVPSVEARVDVFPEVADSGFDDYIFVFPADSGLPPLYLVFKSARDMPGVASGLGKPVSGVWLDRLGTDPAPVPEQVAAQLAGRDFSNFDAFRRSFWKAVAADAVLGAQFSPVNLINMREGKAPRASSAQEVGKRQVYELHHIVYIAKGGEVYNVDNLHVLTPKQHISIHKVGG
jgi:hypothetical protein